MPRQINPRRAMLARLKAMKKLAVDFTGWWDQCQTTGDHWDGRYQPRPLLPHEKRENNQAAWAHTALAMLALERLAGEAATFAQQQCERLKSEQKAGQES